MPQTLIELTVSSRDLLEMARFYNKHPWGSRRDNIHAGFIAATIANAFKSKKHRAFTYQDFMLVDRMEHAQKENAKTLTWFKAVAKKKKK